MKLGRVALVLLALVASLGLATAVSAVPPSPKFEGMLLKGEHWYELGTPTACDGCDYKVFLGGQIIQTGQE